MATALYEPKCYQAATQALFMEVAQQVLAEFPDVQVEHIGSTAIPGALSKGDLDIAVLVPPGQVDHFLPGLLKLGFKIQSSTLRTPQLCMLKSLRQDVDLALQVIERGSRFEFFLTFRDRLRANPDLVIQYNQVKQASKHLDDAAYRAAKSRFIEQMLSETMPNALEISATSKSHKIS